MIEQDFHGNKFVRTCEGTLVPLTDVPVSIKIESATVNGMIVPVWEVLAEERTLALHWFAKYREAMTTIADLREQLAARG